VLANLTYALQLEIHWSANYSGYSLVRRCATLLAGVIQVEKPMRSSAILLILILICSSPVFAETDFETWFEDSALRVDLYHSGDAKISSYSLDELIIEGDWPGNRVNLIDTTNLGNSRFNIYDAATGTLIYSRGYSTMFGEWQTTDEAQLRSRTMQETIRLPKPKGEFDLVIEERDEAMAFQEMYRVRLDPNYHSVRQEIRHRGLKTYDLHIGSEPKNAFDIVILADGYTAEEQEKLVNDAQRLSRAFISHAPFAEHAEKLSIRTIGIISNESGIDQPREDIFVDSALSCTYNTFDSARYVLTGAVKDMRDYAALVPYDAIVIMFNTDRYGGGGIFNLYCTFAADDDKAAYLFLHEGGHSLFGLGDEYYSSSALFQMAW